MAEAISVLRDGRPRASLSTSNPPRKPAEPSHYSSFEPQPQQGGSRLLSGFMGAAGNALGRPNAAGLPCRVGPDRDREQSLEKSNYEVLRTTFYVEFKGCCALQYPRAIASEVLHQ